MQIEEGKALYLDRGYPSDVGEEVSPEDGLLPRPIRPVRRERYLPWMQDLAITSRRGVETVGSMLHGLFLGAFMR